MQKITVLKGQMSFSEFYPGSIAMVTAVDLEGWADICTVGVWALVNGKPPMYGFPLCNKDIDRRFFKRYTLTCIEQTKEFVINIPDLDLRRAWAKCGSISLRHDKSIDKFKLCGLEKGKPLQVKPPLIEQCPVNIECRLINIVAFSCHDWVVGEAVAVHRAFNDVDVPKPIPVLKMANACAGKKRLV